MTPFSNNMPKDNTDLRHALYAGEIFRIPATPESLKAVAYANKHLAASMGNPTETAHTRMTEKELLDTMRKIRNAIIEDKMAQSLVRSMIESAGFLPSDNTFDVMRVRAVMPKGHNNSSLKRSYSVHRDTWYANPQCQINWWIALPDVPEDRAFSFYPEHFEKPVKNDSDLFDYNDWMQTVGWQNTRGQGDVPYPYALNCPPKTERTSFSCNVGDIILFSSAHLHGTNPNETNLCRFSLDFRTVHLEDHKNGKGAPNVDNDSTPDALHDYIMPERTAA